MSAASFARYRTADPHRRDAGHVGPARRSEIDHVISNGAAVSAGDFQTNESPATLGAAIAPRIPVASNQLAESTGLPPPASSDNRRGRRPSTAPSKSRRGGNSCAPGTSREFHETTFKVSIATALGRGKDIASQARCRIGGLEPGAGRTGSAKTPKVPCPPTISLRCQGEHMRHVKVAQGLPRRADFRRSPGCGPGRWRCRIRRGPWARARLWPPAGRYDIPRAAVAIRRGLGQAFPGHVVGVLDEIEVSRRTMASSCARDAGIGKSVIQSNRRRGCRQSRHVPGMKAAIWVVICLFDRTSSKARGAQFCLRGGITPGEEEVSCESTTRLKTRFPAPPKFTTQQGRAAAETPAEILRSRLREQDRLAKALTPRRQTSATTAPNDGRVIETLKVALKM